MSAVLAPLVLTIASVVGVGHAPRLTPSLPRPCLQAITALSRANNTLTAHVASITRLEAQLAKPDPSGGKRVTRLIADLKRLRAIIEMDDLRLAEAYSNVARLCGPT